MVIMEQATEVVSTLEEEALRRKERLKNLKRKNSNQLDNEENKESLPKPKFRSYKPQDETLQEAVVGNAKPANVDEEVKDQLNAANEKVVLEELDIASLAPRKPDWDLKRDVAKKLEKLERRTQKAIAQLIWEKLKSGEKDDLGAIVNLADKPQSAEDD